MLPDPPGQSGWDVPRAGLAAGDGTCPHAKAGSGDAGMVGSLEPLLSPATLAEMAVSVLPGDGAGTAWHPIPANGVTMP